MTLRILYSCTVCRRLVVGPFYNLTHMYGLPVVCAECCDKEEQEA